MPPPGSLRLREDVKLLWPGEARAFPLAELEAAKRWAAAEADD